MKLICGPMATVSHPAFRFLVERFGGCDEYFTEMINAGTLLTGGPFEKYYLDSSPCPQKIVWQLTSKNTELMLGAVERIVKLDGIGIDLNMGCSAPDIYKTGAGISWMIKDRAETFEMVKSAAEIISEYNSSIEKVAASQGVGTSQGVAAGGKKRFSVKLRLGDDNFTDEGFFSFCDGLVECGVQLLTLHPRTKKEKLTLTPRYAYCQKLVERYKGSGVQVYLNGNIKDKASYDYALSVAPDVDGVMISRASVQKPWIFSELKRSSGEALTGEPIDMQSLALGFIDDVEKYQPPEFWKTRLQRFFTYFSMNFKFSHYAQTQFLNAKDNEDLRLRISDFFEKCPEERFFTPSKL